MRVLIMTSVLCLVGLNQLMSQNFITVGNAFGVPTIQGEACLDADTCFTLTEDLGGQAGAVWDSEFIDLSDSFDATFCLYLGENDAMGADGFAFVLRSPDSIEIGGVGQGLGYADFNETLENEGIFPSVAFEYDTWDNGAPGNDIPDDHTSLFFNGNLAMPIQPTVPLLGEGINAEDGEYHTTRIVWDALTFQLDMYFDDVLLISHTENIINSVFSGNSEVFWGFTSSTGGSSNLQQICFPSTSVITNDYLACEGETVEFSFFVEGLTMYRWTDDQGNILVDWDLNDGTELTDTTVTTTMSGTYFLEIEFNNNTISDSVEVTFIENPESPFITDFLELCPEVDYPVFLNALNPGSSYEWQNGFTEQSIELEASGWYSVEVSEPIIGCTTMDSIQISHFCEPQVAFPNVFSPNGDSLNQFFIPAKFDFIGDFDFRIFNRWGAEVYTTTTNIKWDGADSNSNPLPDGVYFYTIHYAGLKGEIESQLNGSITVFSN